MEMVPGRDATILTLIITRNIAAGTRIHATNGPHNAS